MSLKAKIEAVIYASEEPVTIAQLTGLLGEEGQAELDALAAAHCPPGRRRYHAALYDALAGGLLLGSLSRHANLASLTVMQLLALSALDPRKRESIVQRELF